MEVLFLAPHPFYQDRGTPIAVNLMLKVLSERGERIDVVTYPEGQCVQYEGVTIFRTLSLPFARGIRPGFSWKKLLYDVLLSAMATGRVWTQRYHLIHAVEESVFIALVLKWIFGIPYVYDMDSSLAQQLTEKYPFLTHCRSLLEFFEGLAIRNASVVVPVCDALQAAIEKYKPSRTCVLQDISLLQAAVCKPPVSLRAELGIKGVLVMYVGNLEGYQGIDLLLESFALVLQETEQVDLVIVGGEAKDIQRYRHKAERLAIHHKTRFLGPKPVAHLAEYLDEADCLVSPRLKGNNTPMKLYSYLHSSKAILATALPTHTQILDSSVAVLAEPFPEPFAKGLLSLVADPQRRAQLGMAGKRLVETKYSYGVFRDKLNDLYDMLAREVVRG